LLISLLLPTLRGAREASQRATCMSRERQLGLAIATYNIEYKFWWPVNNIYDTSPGRDSKNPRFYYSSYADGNMGQIVFAQQIRPILRIPGTSLDTRGLPASKNFLLCPAAPVVEGTASATVRTYAVVAEGNQATTYGLNAYFGFGDPFVNDPGNARYLPKRGEVRKPYLQVVVGESVGDHYFGYLMPNYLPNAYAYWHPNDTMNMLFADGHVASFVDHVGYASASVVEWYGQID
jgi:prepilin-type processing-associated H-X9-DG protein